jgi:hypothetical protein
MAFDCASSVVYGMETPDAIDLRKGAGQETPGAPVEEGRESVGKRKRRSDGGNSSASK